MADRTWMSLEWSENMERSKVGDDAHAECAKRQRMEGATLRQRKCRSRKMASQIKSRKRDSHGKIIKAKMVLVSEPSSSLNVAEATQPNRAFKEDKHCERTDVG